MKLLESVCYGLQQLKGIREFCIFVSVLYIQDWFSCKSAVEAPKNDLNYIKNAIDYAKIDEEVSNKVLKRFPIIYGIWRTNLWVCHFLILQYL